MKTLAFDLQPFDRESSYLPDAARVYIETWQQGEEWAHAFIAKYALYPDFRGFVALVDGSVVGMGFGTRSALGQWWHNKVAAQVGSEHPALQNAWALVELSVLKPCQGLGIGGRLHDRLLESQPLRRALLSTQVANTRARQMYEQRGWQYLHHGFAFEDGRPQYVVMGKELR